MNATATPSKREYWSTEISKAKRRYASFHTDGHRVVDEYRLQKADTQGGSSPTAKDKFNILFSSTETIRPNLYAKTPVVRATLRHKDRARQDVRDGVALIGKCGAFLVQEGGLDDTMNSVVEDLLLPGIGQAWVLYEPTFEDVTDDVGKPVYEEDGKTVQQRLLSETVRFSYIFWEDFLTGMGRTWETVPWVAKRCHMTKEEVEKRFGKKTAETMSFNDSDENAGVAKTETDTNDTAEVWEIWCKRSKTVYWFAEGYKDDLLAVKKDPLKLQNFFPCPRPLRAISNTRTFVPRSLYSQYKTQAEAINDMTRRIRLLQEALRVVGLFDASNENLASILSANSGNRMIPVQNWQSFKDGGGLKGAVEWLPLNEIVTTLEALLRARDVAKAEIYEITGFSDIVRGMSKASETLGAQTIKANWAGARVKQIQQEVQRFACDLIAIACEIVAEFCSPQTIAMFGGVDLPTEEDIQSNPEAATALIQRFDAAIAVLRNDMRRIASIEVETDSTLQANEEAERADRSQMLAAAGAFLQQAVPAMEATPELGPLLGAMLMFTVRSFPSSRDIEDEFEKVQKALASRQPEQDKGGAKAKAAADQAKAQADQAKAQADAQARARELEIQQQKAIDDTRIREQEIAARHDERMAELDIERQTLRIEEMRLQLERDRFELERIVAEQNAAFKDREITIEEQTAAHEAEMAEDEADRDRERIENEKESAESDQEAEDPLTGDDD